MCIGLDDYTNMFLTVIDSQKFFIRILLKCRTFNIQHQELPTAVSTRSKVSAYVRSFAGIMVSNPAGAGMFLVWVLFYQVQISASGWSPVQSSPAKCIVSNECDSEAP
jgi:hypothetical protein